MDVRLMYSINNKTDGGGFSYSVPKKYQTTKIQKQKAKPKKPKHKKTFIDQYVSVHKIVPGADAYFKQKKKSKSSIGLKRINFTNQMKKGTKTFIDQIIKQKSKVPGVGKYNPEIDRTQDIRKAYKFLNDKIKNQIQSFRPTAFGETDNNPDKAGPGDYQPYGSIELGHSGSTYVFPPLKKGTEDTKQKARSRSLSKLPGPGAYDAQPAGSETFSKKLVNFQSGISIGKKQVGFSTSQRSSLPKIIGPGPKYSLISQWASEKQKIPTVSKNIFKIVSQVKSPSIYN